MNKTNYKNYLNLFVKNLCLTNNLGSIIIEIKHFIYGKNNIFKLL